MTDTPLLDEKLLPCPFCGGKGAHQTDTEENEFSEEWIGCLVCGATTAVDAWNMRALSTRPATEVVDRLPTHEEASAAALVLSRCNGYDLDTWTDGSWPGDDFNDAIAALTSTAKETE